MTKATARYAIQLGTATLLVITMLTSGGEAQPPSQYFSNACRTNFGVCYAAGAPVGAPCTCGGGDPGRMVFVPMQTPAGRPPIGTACGTRFGVCPLQYPLQLGSPCTCFGPRGPDPGQVISP
jgi:hypothetical protein